MTIFNVVYEHLIFDNGDELYATGFGLSVIENLFPENIWTDQAWFARNAERLCGTSCIYRIRTREVNGRKATIVLKWNRMGQEIPGIEFDEALRDARFNSPFEEFSLVMELRKREALSSPLIMTHKPLAIYVPGEHIALWKSGRREDKFELLVNRHKDVTIDIHRLYAVVYEWIKGIDAAQLCKNGKLTEKNIEQLTLRADEMLRKKGFFVHDRKPHHIILRPLKNGGILTDRKGDYLFGLIDFELLESLPERDMLMRKSRRSSYLHKQKERFNPNIKRRLPQHLSRINILGVDYIYGRAASTQGTLWVVGLDPDLFDYFLPEKWEKAPRIKLSVDHEIFYTLTKDNIHLVFKISKVGIKPDLDPFKRRERLIIDHGYNSPFEEVSLACELGRYGIPTIYPRGIYMTGYKVSVADYLTSESRYLTHQALRTPDAQPVLQADRDYIIIYGYWNGPDEKLSQKDSDYYEGVDALRAYKEKIIERTYYLNLMRIMKEQLRKAGMKDLNLKGSHFLLSLDSHGAIIKDAEGIPEMRYCNFEFLKKIGRRRISQVGDQ